jgi:hypothetical protein
MEVEGCILPEDVEPAITDVQNVNSLQLEPEGKVHDAEVLGSVQPPMVLTVEVPDTELRLAEPLPPAMAEQIICL